MPSLTEVAAYSPDMAEDRAGKRPPATMSVPEAAELLGVSEGMVRSAIAQGHIATIKIGKLTRVLRIPLLKSLELPEDYEI